MVLSGSQTEKNLMHAFMNESQARNLYTFYAKQANKDGYPSLCNFFLEKAEQERSHAKQLMRALEGGEVELCAVFKQPTSASTLENLKEAFATELDESENVYPKFAEIAKSEGFPKISHLFTLLAQTEKVHAKQFEKFIVRIEHDTFYTREQKVVWECKVCGFEVYSESAPQICPLCKHDRTHFEENKL